MSSNNPWADSTSQGNPYVNHQGQEQQGLNQAYYADNQSNQHQQSTYTYPQQSNHGQTQESGHEQPQQGGYNAPPGQPPPQSTRRSETEQLLEQQSDRAEQMEYMQQYEAAAPQSEDDKNQAELQREFPNVDSSLIAAIYHERKPNLGEVRELLQELNSS